jgi:dihydroorotate dehydrogenase
LSTDLLYSLAKPFLHALDPERAHRLTVLALKAGLVPGQRGPDDPILASERWGMRFPNPVGLSAGFDKHAEVIGPALKLGFGFIEPGGVTPVPQSGNPAPRLFRLDEDEAVINRFGFNSLGLGPFVAQMAARDRARGIVGVNLGKNKTSEDGAADFVAGVEALAGLADYITINVSSPNTPGLRALQGRAEIENVLGRCAAARDAKAGAAKKTPLLVKIAPELTESEMADIVAAARVAGIDGFIVANTTTLRPDTLRSPHRAEAGGLSGRPLTEMTTRCVAAIYRLTEGKTPIVGSGGIASGAHAYAKIKAGASLVQLYSALVFHGPGLVQAIKRDLAAMLRADGFSSLDQAVGTDHR